VNKTHICAFKDHAYSENWVVTQILELPPKKKKKKLCLWALLQCPKSVHKKIHPVRYKTIGAGGITFIYDLNVLWNFLFRSNEITNFRIVIGIYLSATLYIYHSEPKLGTRNAFNMGQTESQNLTVLTLKEMSKPNLSTSTKIK
jgi:hypothetical protein